MDACNVCTDLEGALDSRLDTSSSSIAIDSYRTTENKISYYIRSLGISYLDNGSLVSNGLDESL